jgi:hypothetical protein
MKRAFTVGMWVGLATALIFVSIITVQQNQKIKMLNDHISKVDSTLFLQTELNAGFIDADTTMQRAFRDMRMQQFEMNQALMDSDNLLWKAIN